MKKAAKIRMWVARLYLASGCSCCRDDEGWEKAKEELGKLLDVPRYDDGSGYDFRSVVKEYENSRDSLPPPPKDE